MKKILRSEVIPHISHGQETVYGYVVHADLKDGSLYVWYERDDEEQVPDPISLAYVETYEEYDGQYMVSTVAPDGYVYHIVRLFDKRTH